MLVRTISRLTLMAPNRLPAISATGLRRAVQTEVNDDMTVQGTDLKARFIQRVNAMSDAADFLMEFANG